MENEKKKKVSMSIEELERVGTTSDNPTLQQTLDLVRKYSQRFYVTEEVKTFEEIVRLPAIGGFIPRGVRKETRTEVLYTIWRVGKSGEAFPIVHRRPDGSKPTAVSLESVIDWLGGWIFNEAPRHK